MSNTKRDLRRQTHTLDETARILGIGRNTAYQAARDGDIYTISIGRRLLVPVAWIEQQLRGQQREAQ